MVVVGGITRLTRSWLSMTDWRPHGKRWPRDEAEWNTEFDRYKDFPEYQRLHKGTGFSLDDFKGIFFWEWCAFRGPPWKRTHPTARTAAHLATCAPHHPHLLRSSQVAPGPRLPATELLHPPTTTGFTA